MALQEPFARRVAEIQAFLELPPFRVMELTRPPDLQLVVQRVLTRLADAPDDRHAWVYLAPEFDGYRGFFTDILDAVGSDVEGAQADLVDMGISVPEPPELRGEASDADPDAPSRWAEKVAGYLSRVADALPDELGSLVVVMEPGETPERRALGWSVGALAWFLTSDRAKVLVMDGGADPLIPVEGGVEDRVVRTQFAVSPSEIEGQLITDLASGELEPEEARRYTLMAGALAASAGRFDEAEDRLIGALDEARSADEPHEVANILYNLGNVFARTGRYEAASETLAEAASLSLATENNALAGMALANLGVSLYHEGRGEEALQSLAGARTLFHALGHRPGEAHALDCTARVWADSDPERARAAWQEALALYESIDAPHLREVREAGRADIHGKLRHLDERTESP